MAEFQIIQGHVLEVLRTLPSNSVHCVITSPPYFPALRSYCGDPVKWPDGWIGSLGDEETPQEFINHLVSIFAEARRVLRDDGSFWLNIGDSYAKHNKWKGEGIKKKDLLCIPWRLGLALQDDGWYLRNDCIWAKPNCLPESVQDRFGRSHEYILHFTKTSSNYFDHLAVREPASEVSLKRIAQKNFKNQKGGEKDYGKTGVNKSRSSRKTIENFAKNPGRNKRTVLSIPVARLKHKHFASFPEKLPEVCIKSSTSEMGVCSMCGSPFIRQVDKTRVPTRPAKNNKKDQSGKSNRDHQRHVTFYETKGWAASCDCGVPPSPAIILDPFNGSGTTGLASLKASRSYIGIELSPEYVEISRERLLSVNPLYVEEAEILTR